MIILLTLLVSCLNINHIQDYDIINTFGEIKSKVIKPGHCLRKAEVKPIHSFVWLIVTLKSYVS